MTHKELLDVKTVSRYLQINEKKVYVLANSHKIPCTKVTGKWLFPKQLIDEWIMKTARENANAATAPPISGYSDISCPEANHKPLNKNIIFHGSNDPLIEILAHKLTKKFPVFSLSTSNIGSLAGIFSLKNGICHICGIHLFDPNSNSYNNSCIKQFLENMDVITVHLAARKQGLIVAKGNPLKIRGLSDLTNITYINRQSGSGTRTLFEYKLKKANIPATEINGYDNEVFTHLDVAIEIFNGSADAGMGIYSAAHALKLDFIQLCEESYDLVIPKKLFFAPEIQALLKIIRSNDFREKASHLGGYNLTDTAEIISIN